MSKEPNSTVAEARKKTRIRRGLLAALGVLALSTVACSATVRSFGKLPSGERLERIHGSAHYQGGEFQYTEPTALWTGEASVTDWIKEMIFGGPEGTRPAHPLPVNAVDLRTLPKEENLIVWLGHSSYFMQLGGKRFLIDPVLSSHTSPVSFLYKAFEGPYPFSAATMPDIDYVLISHDHWDHLDFETLTALRTRIKHVVVPLGVGSHLDRWGFSADQISEGDWFDHFELDPGISINVLPSRHFSGRGLRSNQTLWGGFLISGAGKKIFYSGDGGYGPHFAEIGRRFGPIDLALMEDGQYDATWANIHMTPEESVKASKDVGAASVIPAHAGRFALAKHSWHEPYERMKAEADKQRVNLLTPTIGQVVKLDAANPIFTEWWVPEAVREQSEAVTRSKAFRSQ